MGYTKDYFKQVANTSNADELMKCITMPVNGDGRIMVMAVAADTGFTSGDLVSITPTASGWLADDVIDNAKQYIGIANDTPGAAGESIRVCMGGISYLNLNGSTKYATAFGGCIKTVVDVPSSTQATTDLSTNHVGWPITSGTNTTAGRLVFMDQPWKIIDSTT